MLKRYQLWQYQGEDSTYLKLEIDGNRFVFMQKFTVFLVHYSLLYCLVTLWSS